MSSSGRAARKPRNVVRLSDARSLRSQEALRAALLRLIEAKPFVEISLRDIAAEAGVSYPTVFKHFASKEALFEDLAREEISDFFQQTLTDDARAPDWRPGEQMRLYVSERRGLWRTLLTAGAVEAMRSEFLRIGREKASARPVLPHGFPVDMVSGVVVSGLFEIIAWWLAQGEDGESADVATMLETLVLEPVLGVPPGFFTSRKLRS